MKTAQINSIFLFAKFRWQLNSYYLLFQRKQHKSKPSASLADYSHLFAPSPNQRTQPGQPRSWRHRHDAHASGVRSEDDALGVPRGQPSPVPYLASALVAQLYLRRLGGQPQQSTGAGTSFTAATSAGICTSRKNSALQSSYQFCHKSVSLACRSEEFSRKG